MRLPIAWRTLLRIVPVSSILHDLAGQKVVEDCLTAGFTSGSFCRLGNLNIDAESCDPHYRYQQKSTPNFGNAQFVLRLITPLLETMQHDKSTQPKQDQVP